MPCMCVSHRGTWRSKQLLPPWWWQGRHAAFQLQRLLTDRVMSLTFHCRWALVGTAGFSPAGVPYTSLAVDSAGTPYLAFIDAATGKATVMKYSAGAWAPVGGGVISSGAASYVSLALDTADTPNVAFSDGDNAGRVTVMKYDGPQNGWVLVGAPGFSPPAASSISLVVVPIINRPAVAFADSDYAGKATVMVLSGASWSVAGDPDFTPGAVTELTLALNLRASKAYVAFRDTASGQAIVMVSENGPSWTPVGAGVISSGAADYVSLALDSAGDPYVAFSDGDNAGKATVMTYTGTGPSGWTPLGTAGFSPGAASYISLAFSNAGTPYAALSMVATVARRPS